MQTEINGDEDTAPSFYVSGKWKNVPSVANIFLDRFRGTGTEQGKLAELRTVQYKLTLSEFHAWTTNGIKITVLKRRCLSSFREFFEWMY